MTPVKDGIEIIENEALFKIAARKNDLSAAELKTKLSQHEFQFSWMKNVGFFGDFFSDEYYRNRLNKIEPRAAKKQLEHIANERRARLADFKRVLKKHKADKFLCNLMLAINEAIFYRSFRSEQFYQSSKYLTNLIKAVAVRLGLDDYKDVFYLIPQEVIDLLKKNHLANQPSITERKIGVIIITNYDKYIIVEGNKAKTMAAQISVGSGSSSELKGQIAYPGYAEGVASIVKSPADFGKVQPGDILIAMSTQPNYVQVLEKAAAFVTEEGGVLCHASVVARELKKPCIIGTQIATSVFKDGDMVEVDADHGVVKKIIR